MFVSKYVSEMLLEKYDHMAQLSPSRIFDGCIVLNVFR